MSQAVVRYQRAMSEFDAVVRVVPEDRWNAGSPCRSWSAGGIVGHVLGAQDMLFAWIAGTRPTMPDNDPDMRTGADPRSAWKATYDEVRAALADPELPGRPVSTFPGGPSTVDEILDGGLVEPLVHAWDLAQAAGVPYTMDEELAAECLRSMRHYEQRVRMSGMFGAEVGTAQGATTGERLLAFLGRDPRGVTPQG